MGCRHYHFYPNLFEVSAVFHLCPLVCSIRDDHLFSSYLIFHTVHRVFASSTLAVQFHTIYFRFLYELALDRKNVEVIEEALVWWWDPQANGYGNVNLGLNNRRNASVLYTSA